MITANNETFEQEVIEASTPVLVDFYADWCGPCKSMAPALHKVSVEFEDKVKFVKVNVDEAMDVASRYSIRGIPTLILFKDGQVADTVVGAQTEAKLASWLATLT